MMSINEIMTPLMDSARTSYHTDGQLKVADLTELIKERPGIATPLAVYQPGEWIKASGWTAGFVFCIPAFADVPIYATCEIRNASTTDKSQGPALVRSYRDKDYNRISYWDIDQSGNYKLKDDGTFCLDGEQFSNAEGTRIGMHKFSKSNKRNAYAIAICIGANAACSFEYRNLVISYYAPIKLGG